MKQAGKPNQLAVLEDEEVLVLSCKTPQVFKTLIDRYETAFLRKAREVVGQREEARDIVVETFTKIYLNAPRFKKQDGASFKSWAYKILLNTAFSYYRRLKNDRQFLLADQRFDWSLVQRDDDRRQQSDLKDLIVSVLTRMPAQMARVLRLHFLEDKPQREIAREEGLTLSAVKTRMHRAKRIFKEQLEQLY